MAENLDDRRLDITNRLSLLTGLSIEQAIWELDQAIMMLFWWAAYADRYAGTVSRVNGPMLVNTLYEPVGVIGVRAPDDPSLLGPISLLAAAIAQGNTVVMLAGTSPIGALDLIPIIQTSDVPAGVVNILAPEDPNASAIMLATKYDDIDAFWDFSNDAATGRAVEEGSVHNLKRTWTTGHTPFNWFGQQRASTTFLLKATSPKTIWVPYGA